MSEDSGYVEGPDDGVEAAEEELDPVGAISYDGYTEPDLPDGDESDR